VEINKRHIHTMVIRNKIFSTKRNSITQTPMHHVYIIIQTLSEEKRQQQRHNLCF